MSKIKLPTLDDLVKSAHSAGISVDISLRDEGVWMPIYSRKDLPLKRILFVWNMWRHAFYGPVSPQDDKDRKEFWAATKPTHALILPKAPTVEQRIFELVQSGNAGIAANGQIVDRREYPVAKPFKP